MQFSQEMGINLDAMQNREEVLRWDHVLVASDLSARFRKLAYGGERLLWAKTTTWSLGAGSSLTHPRHSVRYSL